jgi:hypothetical protein
MVYLSVSWCLRRLGDGIMEPVKSSPASHPLNHDIGIGNEHQDKSVGRLLMLTRAGSNSMSEMPGIMEPARL